MKIVFANAKLVERTADTPPMFSLTLGDRDKMLSICVALDEKARQSDNMAVAKALRDVADKLEAAP